MRDQRQFHLLVFYVIILLLFFQSCSNKNGNKELIGTLHENQGMVTWKGNLYSDSTFFIPNQGLISSSSGRFIIKREIMSFETFHGSELLSGDYKIDTNSNRIYPLNSESFDWICFNLVKDSTMLPVEESYSMNSIRFAIKDKVHKLEKDDAIINGVIGYYGIPSNQIATRVWLMRNATVKELEMLTDYPSGVIKAIALQGLIHKPNVQRYQLLKNALNDTATFFIYQSGGCVGAPMMLGEYLLKSYFQNDVTSGNRKNILIKKGYLTEPQQDKIYALYKMRLKNKMRYLSQVPEFNHQYFQ